MPYCENCGTEASPDAEYCPACGSAVEAATGVGQQNTPQSGHQRGRNQQSTQRNLSQQSTDNSGRVTRRTLLGAGGGVAALGAGWFVLFGSGSSVLGSPPLDELDIQFSDIRRPSVGPTSATLPIILTFTNPTDTMIPDISGDFDAFISGQRIASDELTVNRIEPGEETLVNADLIVQYMDSGAAVVDAIRAGSYQIELRMTLNAGGVSRELTLTNQV